MPTKSIALRIDTKLLECLETRAAREHRTLSNMIVSILLDEIERKEHDVMSPDEFKNGLLEMFSSIWDCEIDHPAFQDTVGELMSAVMQLYARAVKWE